MAFGQEGIGRFNVRVYNPMAKTYANSSIVESHRQNENDKKRQYNDRILQIEHGSFTPLVFSCLGGMSKECSMFYKRLSEQIAEKRKCDLASTYSFIKAKLNFSLIRTAVLCIRGTRDSKFIAKDFSEVDVETAVQDAKLKI